MTTTEAKTIGVISSTWKVNTTQKRQTVATMPLAEGEKNNQLQTTIAIILACFGVGIVVVAAGVTLYCHFCLPRKHAQHSIVFEREKNVISLPIQESRESIGEKQPRYTSRD